MMKKQTTDKKRRALLKGMFAIPVVTFVGFQTSAQAAMVSISDPTAKALAYTENSVVDGETCSNCVLFSAPSGDVGNCAIFPGKQVTAAGYCKSWAAKA
jgi:hypothetical protein